MGIRNILIDTNAYVAFKQRQSDAVEIIMHVPVIGISSIVLGELFAGFAVGNREKINTGELRDFLSSERIRLFSADADTARFYGTVYRNLKHKGRPVPTNDMWIAAIAIQHHLSVFSYDRHSQKIKYPECRVGSASLAPILHFWDWVYYLFGVPLP